MPTWLATLLDHYYEYIDPQEGVAFRNRRALEESMLLINSKISSEVKAFQNKLQQLYPCYFESFRTDGIEYDIYLGQSFSPHQPFDLLYLREFRLLQLSFMAEITRSTHSLVSKLKVPLQTTQLIFANDRTIDISFRKDEKRFDVEGAYNIRYQMMKKRIDKVHIKGTGKRLTQPGKIAIVYFNGAIAEEYTRYIAYLQEQKIITEEVEYLELEDLQGVSGLKAIRAGVLLDMV